MLNGTSPDEIISRFPGTIIGLDNFHLSKTSELRKEHLLLNELIENIGIEPRMAQFDEIDKLTKNTNTSERTKLFWALLERTFAHEFRLYLNANDRTKGDYFFRDSWQKKGFAALQKAGVDNLEVAKASLAWLAIHRKFYYVAGPGEDFYFQCLSSLNSDLSKDDRRNLLILRSGLNIKNRVEAKCIELIDALVGDGFWKQIYPIEIWSEIAVGDLESLAPMQKECWSSLLKHCQSATSSKPSDKWMKRGCMLSSQIDVATFNSVLNFWFERFEAGSQNHFLQLNFNPQNKFFICENNQTVLKGLVWLCKVNFDAKICRSIGNLARSCFVKIETGPRAAKVANACIYVLGEISSVDSLKELSELRNDLLSANAQKKIDSILTQSKK